jgi:hypothetical protein
MVYVVGCLYIRSFVVDAGVRGLNLAAVKHTTVQVTRLPF